MKLSIAVADKNALASAFVVYRGFNESIPKAAKLGYDGVELALRRVSEINVGRLEELLQDHGLEVSCISTGQVFADGGLSLTHDDKAKREDVKFIFREFIDLAERHGKIVNIGRVRGAIGDRDREYVENLLADEIRELCEYALPKEVTLILEPVNRYECDFINTVQEGVQFVKRVAATNLMLLPDVFHMNIEERHIGAEIARNIAHIRYLHFADSNRWAPGRGHTDFKDIFENMQKVGYKGWISAEILPKPTPDSAAKDAIDFLRPFMRQYATVNGSGSTSRKPADKPAGNII